MMFNFINRRWKLVLIIFVVAGFGILIYFKLFSGDIPPPDVSDLAVEYKDIPADENAFTYISEAADIYDSIRLKSKIFQDSIEAAKYDAAEMTKFMALSEKMFEHLDRGLKCERLQFPAYRSYDTLLPYLKWFRQLARMQLNRALYLFKHGKEKEAFEVLINTMKFGAMMERGKGCIINYLVGYAIKDYALTRFRELLTVTTLGPEVLKGFMKKLDEFKADGEGLAYAFKLEYRVAAACIDDIRDGKITYRQLVSGSHPSPRPSGKRLTNYSLKPNMTKKMFAGYYRNAITNIKKLPGSFMEIKQPVGPRKVFGYQINIGNNWMGRRLYREFVLHNEWLIIQRIRGNINVGATQLLIALKCYKIENGDLPETLEELVPEFIDKLPVDGYDGRPLRYSREKKIIYCLGDDLEDTGGPPSTVWKTKNLRPGTILWRVDDPAVKIDF